MVSSDSLQAQEAHPTISAEKKSRKKKGYQGETVADRLLASAKRMEQLKLSKEAADTIVKIIAEPGQNESEPVKSNEKLSKTEKLRKAAHEIDDLSALEWETSSEQSVM